MSWEDFLALSDGDWMNWDEDLIIELMDTGSVTMDIDGRKFILTVKAEEVVQ